MKKTDKYKDQKNKHGAGRPHLPESQKMVQVSLSMSPVHARKLRAMKGHGASSKMLRRILDDHLDEYISGGKE